MCTVGAVLVRADRDRDDGLASVAAKHWDAVIDVARQPGHVRRAVRGLGPMVERYVLVSSGNVYASQKEIGQNEETSQNEEISQNEDALLPDPLYADVMASMENYGAAKVACQNAALAGFGSRRTCAAPAVGHPRHRPPLGNRSRGCGAARGRSYRQL